MSQADDTGNQLLVSFDVWTFLFFLKGRSLQARRVASPSREDVTDAGVRTN
jgi:hypothetical protein